MQCARVVLGVRRASRMCAWRAHGFLEAGAGARAAAAAAGAEAGGGVLQLDEVRVPALRAPDDVLVRVHAASINPLDVAMLEGYGDRALSAWRRAEAAATCAGQAEAAQRLPLTPGRDFSGEVVRAGPASDLRAGDEVWGVVPPHWPGSHAQYVLVKDAWTSVVPARLAGGGAAAGAGGALYAGLSAWAALRAAGLAGAGAGGAGAGAGARRRVLLLGLGGVGQAALQLLRHYQAQVTVGCSGELHETARRLGAAAALDRHAEDYERQIRDHGPYWAVVDVAGVGGSGAAALATQCARYVTLTSPVLRRTDEHGLLLGAAAAAADLAAQQAAAWRAARAAGAAGAWPGSGGGGLVRWAYFSPSREGMRLIYKLTERGEYVTGVQRVWGWRRAADAYAAAAAGGARGKHMLDFTCDECDEPRAAPPAPAPAKTHN